ncbi:zf-TFIIB domain-containing protein [Myxococcota bacterium]|nr:zf-TFIIB domain-containing protein [Myxococcota bacterium]
MKCPTCPDSVLVMADRSGIEIDYCPACRGVWLDRGELDKIIERASPPSVPAPTAAPQYGVHPPPTPAQRPRYDDDDDDYRFRKKYKKKSILGEIFDF